MLDSTDGRAASRAASRAISKTVEREAERVAERVAKPTAIAKDEQWSVSLPKGLRGKWKAHAAKRGISMRDMLIAWIDKDIAVTRLERRVRSDSG